MEMVRTYMSDASDRSMAERFAPSAANFGLLIASMSEIGMKVSIAIQSHCCLLYSIMCMHLLQTTLSTLRLTKHYSC